MYLRDGEGGMGGAWHLATGGSGGGGGGVGEGRQEVVHRIVVQLQERYPRGGDGNNHRGTLSS